MTDSDEGGPQIAGYGERIRRARQRLEITQRELGLRVGATDSYISHLENELRVPSWDFAVELTRVFGFSEPERQEFLASVDSARLERARSRSGRRVGSGLPPLHGDSPDVPQDGEAIDPDRIARDLQAHPRLDAAYRDLVTAFSLPGYRDAAIKTLRGLAQAAAAESGTLSVEAGTSDGA
ncbi:MAG: helix-turn-helix transcriptional regulator [Acidobacteriota bacterium]|nr:MAG: helix-turn-helix transcriptional regulator [Acidobacteriota bacterium]